MQASAQPDMKKYNWIEVHCNSLQEVQRHGLIAKLELAPIVGNGDLPRTNGASFSGRGAARIKA